MLDINVSDEGSVVGFQPATEAGRAWIDGNLSSEPWQWLGDTLYVASRCAGDVAERMQAAGLALG